MIAKLHVYGLYIDSINILQYYLSEGKKWILFITLGKQCSPGYFKALLLDNFCLIYLCATDMFLILKAIYFTAYADDNTRFVVWDNVTEFINALEEIIGCTLDFE